jgi:outer membrane protein W
MLRNVLVVAVLGLLPALAGAQVRGPFEVMVSANGENGNKFNGFTAGGTGSFGYFFTDNLEVAIRDTVNYSDIGSVSLNNTVRLATDFHFPLGEGEQFLPYAGANIGYVSGHDVRDTFEAAPEIGIKVFVGQDAFVDLQAEYEFFFRNGGQTVTAFKNGEFVYTLGVGFRF